MFDRMTEAGRQTVCLASEECQALRSGFIGTGHLLLGLLREGDGVGAQVLAAYGIGLEAARAAVGRLHRSGDGPVPGSSGELLRCIGIDIDEVLRRTEETFGRAALDRAVVRTMARSSRRRRRDRRCTSADAVPLSPRAKRALELSLRESLRLGDRYIGTEHLLLGLLRDAESEPPRRTPRRAPADPGVAGLLRSQWDLSPALLRAAVEERVRRAG